MGKGKGKKGKGGKKGEDNDQQPKQQQHQQERREQAPAQQPGTSSQQESQEKQQSHQQAQTSQSGLQQRTEVIKQQQLEEQDSSSQKGLSKKTTWRQLPQQQAKQLSLSTQQESSQKTTSVVPREQHSSSSPQELPQRKKWQPPLKSACGQPRQQQHQAQHKAPSTVPEYQTPALSEEPAGLPSLVRDLNIRGQERGGGGKGTTKKPQEERRPGPSTASSLASRSVATSKGVEAASGKPPPQAATIASTATTIIPTKPKSPEGIEQNLNEKEKNRWISCIPKRKNANCGGNQGRPIKVYTNMISIIFNSNFKNLAVHYDVKFDPDKPRFLRKLAFIAMREKKFPRNWPAFDGKINVFSAGNLPFGNSITDTVEIFDEERQTKREVKVTMTKVNEIDMSWLKSVRPGIQETERDQLTIQVLDVVLRSAPFRSAIPVGRSFFREPKNDKFDLTGGMELYTGIFQSAILGWKPYFNVDVAHKAFPKSTSVINIMTELCADRNGPPRNLTIDLVMKNWGNISKFLTGLKVTYQLPGKPNTKRTVGVNGIDKPAKEAIFSLDNGQQTTVQNYFSGSKDYRMQRPDLPCLWVGSKNKRILLPPELCTVAPEIVTNRKLNEEQTRNMIRKTATPAYDRKSKIERLIQETNYNQDPTLKEFGISLNGAFEEVNARVLNPPSLLYRDNKTAYVAKGVWRALNFISAQSIPAKAWTILNFSRYVKEEQLRCFSDKLRKFAGDNGMIIGEPDTPFRYLNANEKEVTLSRQVEEFLQAKKQNRIQLIVVVIPPMPSDLYPRIKQIAELKIGVLTQCLKEQTLRKLTDRDDRSTAGNILLKINSKLNGINHTFTKNIKPACLTVPTIIFGADVTHPSPDATDIPSIAAVAASSTADVFKYNIEMRIQPARQEIILDLKEIVFQQLTIFQKANRLRPQNVIFYRDGVSEGQFPQVMHHELQAIKDACRRFGGAERYEPKITFLVVQKRHHTRFFPSNAKNSDDRNGNVQAGTIVDTQITHPSHIDFYLVSHASIQGTARPTKYRCLWDDNHMSEDDIETLTYYLCHMFSRCNRSVSYPAPTYYAHLAAFRARALISGVKIKMDNLQREQLTKLTLNPDLMNNNPMFFV